MRGMNRNLTIALVLLISLGFPATSAAVDFASPASYPVGVSPSGIAVADFNGDGKPDIAVANSGSGNVSILLGNGDGTFQAAMNFDAGMANPSSVVVGDFNGDGKLDLAAFLLNSSGPVPCAISILLGRGDGSFQPARTTTLPQTTSLVVADFNLDHKTDVAFLEFDASFTNATISVLVGNGDGTFQPAKLGALLSDPDGSTGNLSTADFDHDGKPDLAVGASDVRILLGKGDATFQIGQGLTFTDGLTGTSLDRTSEIGDFNGDGKMDLVVLSTSFSSVGSQENITQWSDQFLSIFLGNGNGTFKGEQIVDSAGRRRKWPFPWSGSFFTSPQVGDFNGDGKLDLAFTKYSFSKSGTLTTESFKIGLGRGDGTFVLVASLSNPGANLAAANLNSDKFSDLVATGNSTDDVRVLLNATPNTSADVKIISASASPDPVGVGFNLTYAAHILNDGPKPVTSVSFKDTLPNGVSFVSATATQGNCIQSRGIVSCDLGSLPLDATMNIVVTPTSPGTITNLMDVIGAGQTPVHTASQTTTVVPVFGLTVTKAGTGSGTVTSIPAGIDCGGVCSQSYASGTEISLMAVPSAGSQFGSWSGACTGTDPNACVVTLNSDQSVTATFNIPPDFSVNPTATSLSVKRGGQVTEALNFLAQGGFSGTISLTCAITGPSPMPTCDVSPASVTPGNTATLTVNTAALSASIAAPLFGHGTKLYALCLPYGLLGCVLVSSLDKKRRRLWALCLLLLVATILPAACGGVSSSGPPPVQRYTVTVAATSGSIQHSTTIPVTVN